MAFAIKTIITSCFLFLFCNTVFSQKLIINGDIKTDSGKGLQDCYLKISEKTNHQVLAFSFLGKDTTFSIELPFFHADSFFISASHSGYRQSIISKYITEPSTVSVHVLMALAPDTLNNIVLNTPPVWVNGDTTFFHANSFKQGDETRLKDLITKMPGFEIDKQGNLLYKKQNVDKIMIEGENIFSDKVKLMLDNFPVYIINNVQVIKNQTDDPLLKGLLNENKLFVNLSLAKKAKLKTVFGDGEAGVGTQNKYFINPVLFSLYGKMKMGYIGNWNNIGNGIGWKEQDELKSAPIRTSEQWMMTSDQLILVNDLENRRYISNGQSDNRFQITIPVSETVKSSTEIDLSKDIQRQRIYNNVTLFDGSGFTKQIDTNYIRNRPYSLLLSQNFNWNISSDKNLSVKLSFYHNGNNSFSNSQINQAGIDNNVENTINNKWSSYLFSISYTHRVSIKKAVKWFAHLSRHDYPQNIQSISASWPSIFQLQQSDYDLMTQQLNNVTRIATLGWTSIFNTRKGIIETGILVNSISTRIVSNLSLSDSKADSVIYPNGFNSTGKYFISSAIGYTKRTIHFFKLPFSIKAEYGIGSSEKSEDSAIHYSHLLYNVAMSNQSKIGKFFLGKFDASYSQHQLEANKLYSILLPNSINSFHNNLNVGLPLKTMKVSYNLAYSFKPTLVLGLYTDFGSDFLGWSNNNHLNHFIQITSDSLTKRSLDHFTIHFNTNVFSLKNDFHFSTDISYNNGKRFIEYQNKLLKTNMNLFYINATVLKSFKKVYFTNFDVSYSNITFTLPSFLQSQVSQNVSDLKTSLSQRIVFNKHSSFVFNTDFFDKNIFTQHQLAFLIADIEYHYNPSKSPFSFTFKILNITNQRKYSFVDSSPLIQNFIALPMIKRNFFVSIRYEL